MWVWKVGLARGVVEVGRTAVVEMPEVQHSRAVDKGCLAGSVTKLVFAIFRGCGRRSDSRLFLRERDP